LSQFIIKTALLSGGSGGELHPGLGVNKLRVEYSIVPGVQIIPAHLSSSEKEFLIHFLIALEFRRRFFR
jgi:hypothetical protein